MARVRNNKISCPKLDALRKVVGKEYGDHVIRSASDLIPFNLLSTGIFNLDLALLGGLPEGYMNMYSGWESVGKTSFALKCGVQALKKYPTKPVVFIDAETHLDILWSERLGVPRDALTVVSDAGMAEAYVDILEGVCNTGEASLIIFDSIASLIPEDRTIKSAFEDEKMANLAKLAGKMFSAVTHAKQMLYKEGLKPPTVLFINQFRASMKMHGSPITLPAGNAQHYVMMSHVQFKRPKLIESKDNKFIIANTHDFEIKKSKSGLSRKTGDFRFVRSDVHPRLMTGDLDEAASVVNRAKEFGFLGGGGSKQTLAVYPDKTFRTMADIAMELESDPDNYLLMKAGIVARVREKVGKTILPYDGNLMGANGKDVLALLKENTKAINEKTENPKK